MFFQQVYKLYNKVLYILDMLIFDNDVFVFNLKDIGVYLSKIFNFFI